MVRDDGWMSRVVTIRDFSSRLAGSWNPGQVEGCVWVILEQSSIDEVWSQAIKHCGAGR